MIFDAFLQSDKDYGRNNSPDPAAVDGQDGLVLWFRRALQKWPECGAMFQSGRTRCWRYLGFWEEELCSRVAIL